MIVYQIQGTFSEENMSSGYMRFYCLLLGLILWNKIGIKISPHNKKQIDYPNHIRNNLWTIWAPVNYKSLLREWWLWGDMSDIQGDSQWGHGVKACLLILQYNLTLSLDTHHSFTPCSIFFSFSHSLNSFSHICFFTAYDEKNSQVPNAHWFHLIKRVKNSSIYIKVHKN